VILFFSKYEGAGNDFILIDDRSATFPIYNSALIQQLSHRQKGIGADGMILLQETQDPKAHFRMRIFNSDGLEATMCGNGLRCLVRFIQALSNNETPSSLLIETSHALLSCTSKKSHIVTHLGAVQSLFWNTPIYSLPTYVVHTGVPHAVIFVDDLESVNVLELGTEIRHHPQFAPEGVNVNFAQRLSNNHISIRTYERGVESETLACGTGAAAVGYVTSKLYNTQGPLHLQTKSGDLLEAEVENESVSISGPAHFVFSGSITICDN